MKGEKQKKKLLDLPLVLSLRLAGPCVRETTGAACLNDAKDEEAQSGRD